MLNPEQMLSAIADSIVDRPVTGCTKYTLCYHEHRFKCLPASSVPMDAGQFGTFSDTHLNAGLTVPEWLLVQRKSVLFFEQVKP